MSTVVNYHMDDAYGVFFSYLCYTTFNSDPEYCLRYGFKYIIEI
jgi:hypothetical protein